MNRTMGKLEGKIALVTGANSGIGLATAKRFVAEGAYVFITGRRGAELADAAKQLERNVTAVTGDVSNAADLDRLFAQIKHVAAHSASAADRLSRCRARCALPVPGAVPEARQDFSGFVVNVGENQEYSSRLFRCSI